MSNDRTYVGFTTDPTRRLKQHNNGTGAKYTRQFGGPWRIVLYITGFATQRHALQMEYAIKHCGAVSKLVKITSKSRNRYINGRVAKLFTVLLKERATARAPLNADCRYKIKLYDDRYRELDGLVDNCRFKRRSKMRGN